MLVYEKKLLGQIFRVLYNGTVITRKDNVEVGYIDDDLLNTLMAQEFKGLSLDNKILHEIHIPLNMRRKLQNFFKKFFPKNTIQRKTACEKIEKFKDLLSDLEYEVIVSLRAKETYNEIAKRLGYSKQYLYWIKSKAIKKIYENQINRTQ